MSNGQSVARRLAAVASAVLGWARPRSGKRIILLHEVRDRSRLREKIAWLAAEYDLLSITDLFARPDGKRTQIALTFDDGYRSWYDAAAPVLDALRVPALFFVCSGFVGLSGSAAVAFSRQRLRRRARLDPLSVAQLRELAAHPLFAIGSHTVTHADLGGVSDRAVFEAEIGTDRRRLEDWTGRPVPWFAFPFGQPENTSPAARRYLEEEGFAAGFTLVPAFAVGADRFAVGRDSLDLDAPTWAWRARLAGGYDGLYRLKRRLFSAGRVREFPG